MPPVFQINITGGGGSGSGGSGGSQGGRGGRIPYAIDPRTEQSWTERHELVMQQREERKREMAAEKAASYQAQQIEKGANKIGSLGTQSGRAFGALLGQAGGPGAAIAGGELGGMLGGQVGGALAGALGAAAAPVAAVLAPLAAVVGATYVAFKAFTAAMDYFVQRGAALAPYSGQIAGARARANVRSQMMDIREAGELGGGISRLTEAQNKFDNSLREMLMPIKRFVVEKLADVMELLSKWMEENGPEVTATLEAILAGVNVLVDLLALDWDKIGEDIAKGQERVQKARDKSHDHINLLYALFGAGNLDAAIDRANRPNGDDQQQVMAAQAANAPAFGGL